MWRQRCYPRFMKVREAMTRIVLTAAASTTLGEAASLMAQRRVGSALVLDGERLVGIFTERDIVKALSQDGSATQQAVGHWMTSGPQTISPDASIEEALQRMVDGGFRHLPVIDGGSLVGMLSMRDISRLQVLDN
jgi:CBS domain-containing protein